MREARAWVRKSHRTKNLHAEKQRWEVIYEDPTRDYRERTKGGFRTKGAAEDWAKDHQDKTRTGTYVDPERGRHTFAEVADEWLNSTTFDKALTADGLRALLRGNKAPGAIPTTFGHLPVGDINYESVRKWVALLKASKSPTTIRNNFYAFRQLMDYAVDTRRVSENPARVGEYRTMRKVLPKVKPSGEREEQRHPLTPAEAFAIIAQLPEPYDCYAMLAADTWMRPEEICGLLLSDIDLASGTIKVHAVVVSVNGLLVREEKGKTDTSRRTITVSSYMLAILRTYIERHKTRALAAGVPAGKLSQLPLFVGLKTGRANGRPDVDRLDFGKPMRHSNFYGKFWRSSCQAVGVPDSVTFYDLRHAGISLHVNRAGQPGALPISEISERAGHASKVMTLDRYTHTPRKDVERERSALDAAFSPAGGNVTPIRRTVSG